MCPTLITLVVHAQYVCIRNAGTNWLQSTLYVHFIGTADTGHSTDIVTVKCCFIGRLCQSSHILYICWTHCTVLHTHASRVLAISKSFIYSAPLNMWLVFGAVVSASHLTLRWRQVCCVEMLASRLSAVHAYSKRAAYVACIQYTTYSSIQ